MTSDWRLLDGARYSLRLSAGLVYTIQINVFCAIQAKCNGCCRALTCLLSQLNGQEFDSLARTRSPMMHGIYSALGPGTEQLGSRSRTLKSQVLESHSLAVPVKKSYG